jgi:hypothetical protein
MPRGKKPKRQLSPSPTGTPVSAKSDTRYDVSNAGPGVQEKAARLVGRSINVKPMRAPSSGLLSGGRPPIESNVRPTVRLLGSEASISGITSSAEQFNSYRFDEISATKTYKKMMTLHLKDKMFRNLKFISNDSQLAFGKAPGSVCGYVCRQMRVPDDQWGDYWDMVREPTKKMIEQQRTNATSAVKKGFKGTITMIEHRKFNNFSLTDTFSKIRNARRHTREEG